MARVALRAGSKAFAKALRPAKAARPARPGIKAAAARGKSKSPLSTKPASGLSSGLAGSLRYRLCKPLNAKNTERLPLLVMLHGCAQDAQSLASISQMNQLAVRERFLVLYPEQQRVANLQGCWNWFATRSGQAQREADAIASMVGQVSRLQPVDSQRVAVAGLSAGASMAALVATRHPECFQAVAMHSGVAPGAAQNQTSALAAMRGRRVRPALATALSQSGDPTGLPSLLVIHGSADGVVVPSNGLDAAERWASSQGALAGVPRTVQRGARHAATITDYSIKRRLVVTHCLIHGLGHAWSGGAAQQGFSDPAGPSASRMIWAFAARQFAAHSKNATFLIA